MGGEKVESRDSSTNLSQDSSTLSQRVLEEASLLGQGFFHGSVEKAYNGTTQLINQIVGTNIEEIHWVDEKKINDSVSGKIGSVLGQTADFLGLTLLSGGLGTAGTLWTMARTGSAAAVFGGVMQPSDTKSEHFFKDRAERAGISFLSGAFAGYAVTRLNASGLFAAPEARSMRGYLAYYTLAGGLGGAGYSESKALIRDHKLLPTFSEFATDVGTGMMYGIGFGAFGYSLSSLRPNPVNKIETGDSTLRVTAGKDGQPVQVDLTAHAQSHGWHMTKFQAVKMTDGTWVGNASNPTAPISQRFYSPDALIKSAEQVQGGTKVTFTQLEKVGGGSEAVGTVSRTFSKGQNNPEFWDELRQRSAGQHMLPYLRRLLVIGSLGR